MSDPPFVLKTLARRLPAVYIVTPFNLFFLFLAVRYTKLLPLLFVVVLLGGLLYLNIKARIIVTESEVIFVNTTGRRKATPRSEVARIRVSSDAVYLANSKNENIQRMNPLWSNDQLKSLSAELGVPLKYMKE